MMMFMVLLLLSVESYSIIITPVKDSCVDTSTVSLREGCRLIYPISILRRKGNGTNHSANATENTGCTAQYYSLSSSHTMCLTDVGTEDTLSATDKQAIINKHNYFRTNVSPTATNLVKLIWDDDVAVIAAKWARQCVVAHDSHTNRQVPSLPGVAIGQNIAAGYSSVVSATISWHDEVNHFIYGYGSTAPRPIGHYTQVVGWRAVRLGCGQATCNGTTYPKYQVCNYAWGQFNPDLKKPYTSGASCSECPVGKCSNKLCDCNGKVCLNGGTLDVNTCSCQCVGIYHGDKCEKDCDGKMCHNGGTLQIPDCTCDCPGIFYGDTCQNVTCPTSESGWCTIVNHCPQAWFLQHCPMLCGVCPRPAACPNKQCQNGAVLKEDCSCGCYAPYSGDFCETLNCPSSDPFYCASWPDSYCETTWTVPFQCPYKCGKC